MSGYNYGTEVSMTITNLNSLASSATAGWQSALVDVSALKLVDVLVQIKLDFANTAPANDQTTYLFVGGALITSAELPSPLSGSQGTCTFPNVSTGAVVLPQLGIMPYITADEVRISRVFSVAGAFGGVLPPKFAIGLINFTGAAIAASGNAVRYQPVYLDV